MPRAFVYACLFALGSCSSASPSGSRRVATAGDAYQQRVLEVVDRAVDPATDKLPQYIGARVHFSFRIDPAGHLSRVRVFAERASDRPVAQIVDQTIRAAQYPPPPPKVMVEQGHPWYELDDLIYLVGAD